MKQSVKREKFEYGWNIMINSDTEHWFKTVDRDKSGKITKNELKAALINAKGQQFSDVTCLMLMDMFDKDEDDAINMQEFQHLFNYINEWVSVFKLFDADQSGNIELLELSSAFQKMGYRLSDEFYQFLVNKFDRKDGKQITIDQFITICIQMQKFTEEFKVKDRQRTGSITVSFEEYLKILFQHFPRI